jgi:hypothetical protein
VEHLEAVVDLAGVDEIRALEAAQVKPVELVFLEREAGVVSVSRCAQVFLTQSFPRPEPYRLSPTLETTPSTPIPPACLNISGPSTSKLSLNWWRSWLSASLESFCD